MARSKKKKNGMASLIIMVVGFAIGVLLGRGLEFDFEDDE